ncbi:MAG: ankyrin repeat domain-containing protein, partial [Chlamydiia bacterium]|nr:ankyrin repeat domain-containing protein [Chlamydiia bacterium]
EVVLKFLDLKPPVNKPYFDGLAPLVVVFQLDHLTVKVVEKLLALGASPTPTIKYGEEEGSLLFDAMQRSNKYEKLLPLLKYRQPVYHADPRKSPFHYALGKRLPRNICEALARQCPIDVADENGKSPLEVALDHNQIEVVRVLIERGADVLKKDAKGQQLVFRCLNHTALQQALLASHPHLATTVFADGTTLLYRSATHPTRINFVSYLLELGAAPEQVVPKIGKSCLELIKSLNTPGLDPVRRLFEQNLQTKGLAHAH